MADSITTNFSTELYSPEYVLEKMYLGNQAIEKGAIYALEKPNSASSWVVPRIDVSKNNLQKFSVTPTDSKGNVVYTEKKFELAKFEFYRTFNPFDFIDIWNPERSKGVRFADKMMDRNLQARIVSLFIKSINEQMGRLIWQGDTDSTDESLNLFNGLLKRIDADADVIDTTNQGVITTSNIFSILEAMFVDIPDEILESTDLKFHMNTTDWKIYGQALKALDFKGGDLRDALPDMYKGIKIVHFAGLPKNRIVLANSSNTATSNLFLGIETLGDITDIQMGKVGGEQNKIYFMNSASHADCQIGFGEEIVNYKGF